MMRRIVFGVALCAGLAPAAGAQSPLQVCAGGPPPFATTEANRLNCQAIDAIRARHSMVFQRPDRRRANCELRYTVPPDRGDGSFAVICEVRCLGRHGWQACQSWGGLPGRTTGVISCSDAVVCTHALRVRAEGEACVTYHREGDRFAVAWVRGGRSCAEGDVTFVAR